MDRSFRALPCLFFIVLSTMIISSVAKPIDVEDIQDPVLKEQIIRQTASLAVSSGEEEEINDSEPSAEALAAERRLPYPLCGTFILCERKDGSPDAQLFTSFRTRIFPKTSRLCRTTTVTGTSGSPPNVQVNHALLWPIFRQEFNELCEYTERQHACFRSGVVTVENSHGHVLYECDKAYEAHTVEFCMSKYSYYCRYHNPADVIFATTSPASPASRS